MLDNSTSTSSFCCLLTAESLALPIDSLSFNVNIVAIEVLVILILVPSLLGTMKNRYLFAFAQVHEEFRIPELQSIAELYNIDVAVPENVDVSRPFMILELDTEEQARTLASRCILVK